MGDGGIRAGSPEGESGKTVWARGRLCGQHPRGHSLPSAPQHAPHLLPEPLFKVIPRWGQGEEGKFLAAPRWEAALR